MRVVRTGFSISKLDKVLFLLPVYDNTYFLHGIHIITDLK